MEVLKIKLVEVAQSVFCTSSDDGQKVFDETRQAIAKDQPVVISFEGVQDLTTAFLNAAIGQLYGTFTEEQIRKQMTIEDASPDDLIILKRVVERAKVFFKDPETFIKATKENLGGGDE